MKLLKIAFLSLLFISLVASLVFAPAKAQVIAAGQGNIVYNLYATDGYINLADGTQLYMYGFVGGRAGTAMTYQNSVVAPPGAPKTFVPGAAITIPDAIAPTGGPVTPAEVQLAGNAQFPAPLIYAAVGDVVEIRLKNLGVTNKNAPNDPHTIHLHGLDVDAANDGVPETSLAAVPANLAAPGAGNVVVYMFTPTHAGTYMYHCHQEADIHVQMGMYGALVVYNPTDPAYLNGGPGKGYGGNQWGFKYDKDVVMLLSEIDVNQHFSEQQALGGAAAFNPVNYHPQYWFVNGLSFPNTIHASMGAGAMAFNWSNWILAHPNYDPLITGSVSKGEKVLIRVINMGFETQPMHMHGFHGKILGSDQRAWTWANNPSTPVGEGLEKNTLTIGSGETYEWLVDFGTLAMANSTYADGSGSSKGTFNGGTQSRYVVGSNLPASNTSNNLPIPVPAVVPPITYIPGPTVTGLWGNPPSGGPSQIFVFHNHDDYKATNNGVYPGGMFTAIIPLP